SADILGAGGVLHPLLEKLVHLVLGDEVARYGVQQLHTGDLGEFPRDRPGLAADVLGLRAALRRRRAGEKEKREDRRGQRSFSHRPLQHNARYNKGSILSLSQEISLGGRQTL